MSCHQDDVVKKLACLTNVWTHTPDAEHPSPSRTDTPSPPQAPRGPMTRARARAIENEVDSLLFEVRSKTHENWVLPHKDMLCILGYQEDDREKEKVKLRASMEQEKEGESKKSEEGGEGEKNLDAPGDRHLQPPGARAHASLQLRPRVPGPWLAGCPTPSAPAAGPCPGCPGLRPRVPGCPAWPPPVPPRVSGHTPAGL